MGAHRAAVAAHNAAFGILYLSCPAISTELSDGLSNMIHAVNMALRKETAAGIHGQLAAEFNATAFDKRPTFAFLTEPIVFQCDQRGVGETVVNLGEVHIFWRHAGHLVGHLTGLFG